MLRAQHNTEYMELHMFQVVMLVFTADITLEAMKVAWAPTVKEFMGMDPEPLWEFWEALQIILAYMGPAIVVMVFLVIAILVMRDISRDRFR